MPDRGVEPDRLAKWFRGLANPERIRILELLHVGERCVGDLAALLGVSQPHMSNRLARLRSDALVTTRRDHRRVYYRIADERITEMIELVRSLAKTSPLLAPGHRGTRAVSTPPVPERPPPASIDSAA